MRTTLDIEQDVLQAAKETAEHERSTAGKVISKWARAGFASLNNGGKTKPMKFRNGIPQFPSRGVIITMEHIQKIMDEEGI